MRLSYPTNCLFSVVAVQAITETRIHYGYRRVHVMLRPEGWRDNHKRIYRLYCEQGLSLRLKRPRRNKSAQPPPQGLYPNHVWGMDFVSDRYGVVLQR